MPMHASYEALTQSAGMCVVPRGLVRVDGSDALKLLHNLGTNTMETLPPGRGCETFWTNVQGKVVGHGMVYRDEDAVWIDTAHGQTAALVQHLDRYIIREDVTLHDASDELAVMVLAGPHANAAVARCDSACGDLEKLESRPARLGDVACVVRRSDWLGVPTLTLQLASDAVTPISEILAAVGVTACPLDVVHCRRVECGWPLYGTDITTENLPQEVDRTEAAICFTKGCYLGQETVARLDALGHVNWLLRGIEILSGPRPDPPTVWQRDGRDQVRVTSVCDSPTLGNPLALGYVRRELVEAVAAAEITLGDQRLRLHALPLT